jgi:beta-lactam-binding protein with PASTA domain
MGNAKSLKRLSKYSVVEAANMNAELGWNVLTAVDISSQTQVHQVLSNEAFWLIIYSDSDVYFTFSCSATENNSSTNDLIWPAQCLEPIRVPRAFVENPSQLVYIHLKQVVAVASKTARLVEL